MQHRVLLPFTAIVGMDKLKLAMIVNAINPSIGGLLIRGPKGSGKTTAVRALTDVLPKIEVVRDCPFHCNPHDPLNMCEKCSATYHKIGKFPIEEREMRVVDLPLGATEDRVVGSLDIEKAIKQGIEALEPGILAEANQNILYVDEINLLPDHIADDLLDAAATGWNIIEREGISVGHPSRFIFVGTMNPEEGELRPQLLDRFPLSVMVETITSVEARMEVVKRNYQFEADPKDFVEKYKSSQEELTGRIANARNLLPNVTMPDQLLEAICKACLDLKVDGMRPDIVINKTARALAAFEGRTMVSSEDVLLASEFALSHRTREGGFLEPATSEEISKTFMARVKELRFVDQTKQTEPDENKRKKAKGKTMVYAKNEASQKEEKFMKNRVSKIISKFYSKLSRLTPVFGFGKKLKSGPKDSPVTDGVTKGSKEMRGETREEPEPEGEAKAIPIVSNAIRSSGMATGIPILTKIKVAVFKPFSLFFKIRRPAKAKGYLVGKRAETITTLHRGRSRGWKTPYGKPRDIHLPATIRAAAKAQRRRDKTFETALNIRLEDVKEKLRIYKAPMTIVFLIDLSGSMLFRIDEVRESLLKLHRDAYRYRDKVGLVAFKDTKAVVVQHPITNLRVVANKLLQLRISGLTPLASGMLKSLEVLKEAKRRDRSTIPVMVIVTDGSANIPLERSLTGELRAIDEMRAVVREYEDLAVRDVMAVTRIVQKHGINTVVVNTNPFLHGRETYGLAVTRYIAHKTGGSHHAVGRLGEGQELVDIIMEKIKEDQRLIAHETSHNRFD